MGRKSKKININEYGEIVPTVRKYRINNAELHRELCKSKEQNQLTPRALELFIMLCENLIEGFRFKNLDDKEDCKAGGVHDLYLYCLKNFNPIYENAFAYCTQIAKSGMAKVFKQLHPEIQLNKKSDIKISFTYLDKDNNNLNI